MEIISEMRKTQAKLKPKRNFAALRATKEVSSSSSSGQLLRSESLPELARAFYNRDPRQVARELLGKILLRNLGRQIISGRIVEVEVYLGAGDLAAHAAFGLTPRNAYLSPAERKQALALSRTLRQTEKTFAAGERDASKLIFDGKTKLSQEPGVRLDYLEIVHPETLDPVKVASGALVAVAGFVGGTRLIDNVVLK